MSMKKILVTFNLCNKRKFKNYDLVLNFYSSEKYCQLSECRVENIKITNEFSQESLNEFRDLYARLKLESNHANNIFNYFYQVIFNVVEEIKKRVDKENEINFIFGDDLPSIYYTGILEQASFPLYSLNDAMSQSVAHYLDDLNLNIRLNNNYFYRTISKIKNIIRRSALTSAILYKLLLSIYYMKGGTSFGGNDKFILTRNLHQSRFADKFIALEPKLQRIKIPSLSGGHEKNDYGLRLSKLDSVKCLVKALFDNKGKYGRNSHYITKVEIDSNNLSIRFYKEVISLLNEKIKPGSRVVSLEQVSPQSKIDNDLLSVKHKVVGIQSTLIEEKEHFSITPFESFYMLSRADYDFFKQFSNSVKYIGSLDFSYYSKLKIRRKNDRNIISILTQPHEVQDFCKNIEGIIHTALDLITQDNIQIVILLHPRDDRENYKSLNSFSFVKIQESSAQLLNHLINSRFVISRTTSLIHDCILLDIPVISLMTSDTDRRVQANYLNYVYKIYDIESFSLESIDSKFYIEYSVKSEEYCATMEKFKIEEIL